MPTLIAVHNEEGCVGRCDARCYDAKNPECECVCGGENHSKGLKVALENTRMHYGEMLTGYLKHKRMRRTDAGVKFDVPAIDPGFLKKGKRRC